MTSSYKTLTVPSQRAQFREFPSYYTEEIAPYLRSLEEERKSAITNIAILGGALGMLAVAVASFGPFSGANIQFAFFIAVGGAAACTWLLNKTRTKINDGLMGRICGKLDLDYMATLSRPDYFEEFRAMKLIPSFNRESWEDEIRGEYRSIKFKLCEAHLKYKSSGKNSSTRTVFHGQLIMIDYPKAFMGKTVIKRDHGVLNRFNKPGKHFRNVGLASPVFEKAFEAWSTDQVEARDLLDPVVLERFQELDRLFKNTMLRAAFTNGELIIAIETGDKLNMGSMFEPLEKPDRVETILKELDVIFDLIDVAATRVDKPIGDQFSVEHVRGAGS